MLSLIRNPTYLHHSCSASDLAPSNSATTLSCGMQELWRNYQALAMCMAMAVTRN